MHAAQSGRRTEAKVGTCGCAAWCTCVRCAPVFAVHPKPCVRWVVADVQELDICNNMVLTGSSLESLPQCCPGLKVLCLTELARLGGGFLSALQHLTVCCMLHAMPDGHATIGAHPLCEFSGKVPMQSLPLSRPICTACSPQHCFVPSPTGPVPFCADGMQPGGWSATFSGGPAAAQLADAVALVRDGRHHSQRPLCGKGHVAALQTASHSSLDNCGTHVTMIHREMGPNNGPYATQHPEYKLPVHM